MQCVLVTNLHQIPIFGADLIFVTNVEVKGDVVVKIFTHKQPVSSKSLQTGPKMTLSNDKFIAGSLKKNIVEWIKIGANSDVIQLIQNGLSLPFSSAPIGYECINHALNVEQAVFINREVNNLLKS